MIDDSGTPASCRLCEEIAIASHGTCFLGFSRGKDSLCSWLFLRNFFDRIIPFHSVSVPGLGFINRSLEYYESFFKTEIIRYIEGDTLEGLRCLTFQPPHDEADIDALNLFEIHNVKFADMLRKKFNLPDAWCALGLSGYDSIERRGKCHELGGRNEGIRTFYPCFDWKATQVIDYIKKYGARIPGDYLLARRSLNDIPRYRHCKRMRVLYPEDFETVKLWFPFIEADLARNEFRLEKEAKCRVKEANQDGNAAESESNPAPSPPTQE